MDAVARLPRLPTVVAASARHTRRTTRAEPQEGGESRGYGWLTVRGHWFRSGVSANENVEMTNKLWNEWGCDGGNRSWSIARVDGTQNKHQVKHEVKAQRVLYLTEP